MRAPSASRVEQVIRLLLVGVAALLAAMPVEAYYQYTHYLHSPYNSPVFEKFDLNALPNKTVTFLVVDTGPSNFGANDDFSSVLSQVKQAAIAWNGVDTSDLRVAFGGLESQGQHSNAPGGDVVFTELPPGVLGLGGVTSAQTPINSNGQLFFPVTRSIMMLTTDTSQAPGPSYNESFFTTAVHEMGHALGLQHTWASAAMSTDITRNTSRARPLDADDIAGLSVLYGRNNWTSAYGSISGRVTANGQGVALASVVAIPQAGPAVSTLTNPDGSYTINGIPPNNNYLVYVHPLPPDAVIANNLGLRLPMDSNNQPLPPFGSPFRTVFFTSGNPSGTNNVGQAASFYVTPGFSGTANFSVTPQSAVSMYDITTYSFNGNASVSPAYTNDSSGDITLVAQANPPLSTPVPQMITALGGFAAANSCASTNNTLPCFLPYSSNNALAIYLHTPPIASPGPRHLVFTLPSGDLYVLPDAFNLVEKDPPAIDSVTSNADGTATVTGSRFGTDSRVFFDGAPVSIVNTDGQSSFTVTPPPGYSGQNASVIVFNSDGQNSTFYQSQNPPQYTYPVTGAPSISFDTASLPVNISSLVNINAANMQFVDGEVTVGFGTSDISVRRVWVLNPTHLVANVVVAPGAAIGSSEISVISGFQVAAQPSAFQVQPGNASLPSIALPLVNDDTNQNSIYPGAIVTMYGSNLGTSASSIQLTLNNQPLHVLYASSGQINFAIPSNFPTGLAVLSLNNGSATAPPLEVQIETAPPIISSITDAGPNPVPSPGDTLWATVAVPDLSITGNTSRVQVTISGTPMYVSQVKAGSQTGTVQIAFVVSQSFGSAPSPVIVTVDGVRSSPYTLTIR